MEIIKVLNQSECNDLKENYGNHHLFRSHIEVVLNKAHCFSVNIFANDYNDILIHSCLPYIVKDFPYQPLSEAVGYIKINQGFLKQSASGCLNGEQVQFYLARLTAHQGKLQDYFISMKACFMLDKGRTIGAMRNEITDGMHRLVAYGLATDMDESLFPIPIYFGTDKTSLSFE